MSGQGSIVEELRREILHARERVYHFGQVTPIEPLPLAGPGPEIWIKREDLSSVKSYKWRGSCNRMSLLSPGEKKRGVVSASAGNHAQGVALAANRMKVKARIYMPLSTPKVKQQAVLQHGGEWVEIRLEGESYDESLEAARLDEIESGMVYIHAYDDLHVMAGQGTMADEVVMSGQGPFDAAYLQIGGGGLAAGVGAWLKSYWPDIRLVGVEGEGQASMMAAMDAQAPVQLDKVDLFCDGTAVRLAGELPFKVCSELLDEMITVSNSEVSQAIRMLWEGLRCISEPSGALGLAAVLKHREQLEGKRVLVILCGANIDFLQLGMVAQGQGATAERGRTVSICIPEVPGAMLDLLNEGFQGLNVSDFQYGKTSNDEAWPLFTLTADDSTVIDELAVRLDAKGLKWKEIGEAEDVYFRAIPLRGDLLTAPAFIRLDFYERPGALHDFLEQRVQGNANLCYFNYRQTGERIGRALIGLDFPTPYERDALMMSIPDHGEGYRSCKVLDEESVRRIVGE